MVSKWLLLFAAIFLLTARIQGRPTAVSDDFEDDFEADDENENEYESGSGNTEESGSAESEDKHEEGSARGTLLDHLADVDDKALKAIAAANSEAEKAETEKETEKEESSESDDEKTDNDSEKSDSEPQDPNALASKILPADLLEKEGGSKEKAGAANKEKAGAAAVEKPKGDSKSAKFSIVLRQNYDNEYEKTDSTKFQMLSGNVKNDIESALKGSKIIGDLKFVEGRIEGNPPTSGKTKVLFNYGGDLDKLKKLVKTGSINGLSVIKDSLEEES